MISFQGLLCGENMRGVKYHLRDAMIHPDPAHRGGSQIIPITRRAIFASFMTASPALVEPIYLVETQVCYLFSVSRQLHIT